MFGDIFDAVIDTAVAVTEVAIDMAVSPIVDGCDLLDGLTEGEFRHKAALRLGAEVVGGMAIEQVIEAMTD